jgi:hypothetical protein
MKNNCASSSSRQFELAAGISSPTFQSDSAKNAPIKKAWRNTSMQD